MEKPESKSVEEKGGRLLPQTVLSGKKSSQIHPLWFPALVECRTNKYWSEKRGKHIFHVTKKRLSILYRTQVLIFSVSHAAPHCSSLLTASFSTELEHSDCFQGCISNLVWLQPKSLHGEDRSPFQRTSYGKRISLHIRMAT